MWRNDTKCKCMFMFPLKNLARKELTISQHCWTLKWCIDGSVQKFSNSIADALELLQSCTKPSIWSWFHDTVIMIWWNRSCKVWKSSGPWFDIKMSSHQYRKSHYGDKTILRPSYLHHAISNAGKMSSLYWIRAQINVRFGRSWDGLAYACFLFCGNIPSYWQLLEFLTVFL